MRFELVALILRVQELRAQGDKGLACAVSRGNNAAVFCCAA
jgi:hypothetical protein